MKTEQLVARLAADGGAVDRRQAVWRFASPIGLGALGALLLMAAALGPRHDFRVALAEPILWAKLAYVATLAATGAWALWRLARPGRTMGAVAVAIAVPLAAMWTLALLELDGAADRHALVLGETWRTCPWLIAALSLPVFVGTLAALRTGAPTRVRWAGAGAGFCAGAVAATIYALHCPEMGAPFLGTWYLAGILIPTALGALLGPRLLRW
jgi:hypothetical protein